jgi:AAHS family 4-hydroxybenzoate transporter-like MFS transporter
LRFLAGIGLGGAIPNSVALVCEYVPRRLRATMVIVMFTGTPFGAAAPGLVSVALVPQYGWPALFVVGGLVPLAVAALCLAMLPESIKHLVVRSRHDQARVLLRRLMRSGEIDDAGRLTVSDETAAHAISPVSFFRDGLAPLTLSLWLAFLCFFVTFYFLSSWTPTLLNSLGLAPLQATLAQSLFLIGGAIGGLALARPMDRRGPMPIALGFAVAVPITAAIGYAGLRSQALLLLVEFSSGFLILGLSFGLIALSGLLYPTAFRSTGSGWALSVGRIGSISGALLGGPLIASHIDIRLLFVVAAGPLALSSIASFVLGRYYSARFGNAAMGQGKTLADRAN